MALKQPAVVGVFTNKQAARRAVVELRREGFLENQLGVAARDKKVARELRTAEDSYAEEGAAVGAAAGAAVGGLWGLGVAMGMLTPVGPVIAGGTLAAVLASLATGAAAASLAGFLVGLGIPEDQARYYENEVKAGRIIVTVRQSRRDDLARSILRRHGGYDASQRLGAPKEDRPAARKGKRRKGDAEASAAPAA